MLRYERTVKGVCEFIDEEDSSSIPAKRWSYSNPYLGLFFWINQLFRLLGRGKPEAQNNEAPSPLALQTTESQIGYNGYIRCDDMM